MIAATFKQIKEYISDPALLQQLAQIRSKYADMGYVTSARQPPMMISRVRAHPMNAKGKSAPKSPRGRRRYFRSFVSKIGYGGSVYDAPLFLSFRIGAQMSHATTQIQIGVASSDIRRLQRYKKVAKSFSKRYQLLLKLKSINISKKIIMLCSRPYCWFARVACYRI